MNYRVLLMGFVLFMTAASAQTNKLNAALDELTARLIANKEVAGINVLVIKDNKTLYNKATGYADVERRKPLATTDIFRIASQTKAITSVAVMMLWEEGRFLLDEPVSKYIPAFKAPRVIDTFNPTDSSYTTIAANREITIRDLLRHTSGITYPFFSTDPRFNAIYSKAGVPTWIGSEGGSLKEKIGLLARQPLVHQPGKAFTYGLNTDVLGYLVEVVSGMPLDVFFQTRIFKPLGMDDTYFKIPQHKAQRLVPVVEINTSGISRITHPIYEGNSVDYPTKEGVLLSGGAGLSSTTADYAKFLQLLLNRGTYNGKRLIGKRTFELMTTNQLDQEAMANGDAGFRFGLGFSLITQDNQYLHSENSGSFYWGGAFNTHYWVDPEANLIGLVFTQQYLPSSYWDLGTLFKNVIYASLND